MTPQIEFAVAGLAGIAVVLLYIFFKSNTVICEPNEVLILSGLRRKLPDGTKVGYRVIRGGRGFRWPIVETVARVPLTNIPIEIHIQKALTSGIIPINVEGRGSIKVGSNPPELLDRAIERFLGRKVDDIARAARQTIEGNLRAAIAQVTPDQANTGRADLEKSVAERARQDLAGLGLVLDYFKVKDIGDDQGYLEAIGRKKAAEVRRDALIAEATAEADARVVTAEQKRKGRVAETEAETSIADREHALEVHKSTLAAETNRSRERALVAGAVARAAEESELERHRIARNRLRNEADTIVPAEAEQRAMEARARGESARILENGRATAEALALLHAQWRDGESKDLFLIRMMPELLDKVTGVVKDNLRIDKLTLLDGGSGNGLPNHVKNLTQSAVVMLDQMKSVAGVDVVAALNGRAPVPHAIPPELPQHPTTAK